MSGRWGRHGRLRAAAWAVLSLAAWAPVAAADNDSCMACHDDRELVRAGDHRSGSSLFVDGKTLDASVHAGTDCVDCHPDADTEEEHPARLQAAACAACHEDEQAQYAGSLHGLALARGMADAPTCADCHGRHDILAAADPASLVNRQKIPATCAGCHADAAFIERRPVRINRPLAGYQHSVHFQSLMADGTGATCTDCHAAHDLYPSADPRSTTSHGRIGATCGRCHEQTAAVFAASIHGQAVAHGNADAPTCIDCHGEHDIRGARDPESSVSPSRVAEASCIRCHESERLSRRYGLLAGRLSTYLDSYHGLASRAGSTTVANCASCHGIHDIRPSTDPLSSVHKANLPHTCGKCHPGAGENFAIGTIHAAPGVGNGEHPLVHLARRLYLWLIVVVVGAMALHNGFDFTRRFGRPRLPYGRDVLRFTLNERLQHALLVLSFLTLAYSGFALKFPEAWWAAPFNWFAAGESSRRLVHRGAALVMLGAGLYHLGWVGLSRRGRAQWRAIRPGLQDGRDALQMARFYLGRAARGRPSRASATARSSSTGRWRGAAW
jgi:nitrate/TMAO reductase-like tetraheme cytochrome c subunit